MEKMILENRKIPGICYAFTRDGIELPVLDVTHPLFTSSINEARLNDMIKKVGNDAARRAESFNKIPLPVKRFFAKRSYIMAGMMEMTSGNSYLSGLSTMMMKMGPGLIGKGRKKLFDRLASKTIGSIMVRMRVRDMVRSIADSLIPELIMFPSKNLCMVNIGGGTAGDSLSALITINRSDPSFLKGRLIELHIMDIDDYGPYFGCRSAEALCQPGNALEGIDLRCSYLKYDWADTSDLASLLESRKGYIISCSSEGGLFEYGDENQISGNLRTIYDFSGSETRITGSLLRDHDTIDPIFIHTLGMTSLKPRLYGIPQFKEIIQNAGWKTASVLDSNPRYIVVSLCRDLLNR